MKKNIDEGTMICDCNVLQDKKQKRICIPKQIVEILNIKKGDKFRWYVKRVNDNRLKISCVYLDKYNSKIHYGKAHKVANVSKEEN